MQYLPFKIMMYVVIGLQSDYVFVSDVTKANEAVCESGETGIRSLIMSYQNIKKM